MGFALGGSSLGNLAAGSAFCASRGSKRAPRRRLPAVLFASGCVLRGSRLWVAVKRVTQSEVAAIDLALGDGYHERTVCGWRS
jgi:hypothetical protein